MTNLRWRATKSKGRGVVVYLHRPIIGGGEVYLEGEQQCDDQGVRE
jgi:hypothetical protein